MMKYLMSEEDKSFKEQVETCEFPVTDFDHRSHIRLAYIYLSESNTEVATQLMRESLNRFLTHNGVDPAKYNETLTKAWILAVHHFLNKTESSTSSQAFIEQNLEMLDSKIMMTHYSAEVLFSDEARKGFVQPDLEPIPRYCE